jgi:GNAT superfamily N-acetyltransferase
MRHRKATSDDIAALVRMRWEFVTDGAAPDGETCEQFDAACTAFLERALTSGRWVVWVAEERGEIRSHIYLQRIEKVPKPGRAHDAYAYMTNVYTRPGFRGRGIGGQLLREACRWAKEAGMEFIIVWPSEESRGFYAREGFRVVEEAMELCFE